MLYVYWGRVFCLEMRSKSQNFPPGLRPGPRDETPSPDAPPRRSGGVVPAQSQWCTLTCISEERREEAINRLLKPAAPPDSGNGVVVPHEAPDGPPKPKKKGKK